MRAFLFVFSRDPVGKVVGPGGMVGHNRDISSSSPISYPPVIPYAPITLDLKPGHQLTQQPPVFAKHGCGQNYTLWNSGIFLFPPHSYPGQFYFHLFCM